MRVLRILAAGWFVVIAVAAVFFDQDLVTARVFLATAERLALS